MNVLTRSSLFAIPMALLVACSDRPSPPASAPTGAPPSSSTPSSSTNSPSQQAPVIPPNTAADVEAKKGTETGMVGGASGDVASGGKPGSGKSAGQATSPPVSSDTDKK
jgi:hypothetical protein